MADILNSFDQDEMLDIKEEPPPQEAQASVGFDHHLLVEPECIVTEDKPDTYVKAGIYIFSCRFFHYYTPPPFCVQEDTIISLVQREKKKIKGRIGKVFTWILGKIGIQETYLGHFG